MGSRGATEAAASNEESKIEVPSSTKSVNAKATVFSLTAKINQALQNAKKTQHKNARVSAMHGIDSDDSEFNASDYSSEESDSDSD